jgi:predicted SnoaL-like aldol condensation-catalyzing enzyme
LLDRPTKTFTWMASLDRQVSRGDLVCMHTHDSDSAQTHPVWTDLVQTDPAMVMWHVSSDIRHEA